MASGNPNSTARPRLAERAEAMWRSYLTGDTAGLDRTVRMVRSVFRHLPSEPRCHVCNVPFAGAGGVVLRAVGYTQGRSNLNPNLCGRCERIVKDHEVGVETKVTLLFADCVAPRGWQRPWGRPASIA